MTLSEATLLVVLGEEMGRQVGEEITRLEGFRGIQELSRKPVFNRKYVVRVFSVLEDRAYRWEFYQNPTRTPLGLAPGQDLVRQEVLPNAFGIMTEPAVPFWLPEQESARLASRVLKVQRAWKLQAKPPSSGVHR